MADGLIDAAARVAEVTVTFLPHVVRAKYEAGYRIHVTFNDGTAATVDFAPWLSGPVFEPLKGFVYFKKFFVDGGTVVWPNGADIAPETLYDAAQAALAHHALHPAPVKSKSKARGRG